MKKWEYIVRQGCTEDTLNAFGSEGWELVQVILNEVTGINRYYFKREKS